jgi:hypothetical protein
MYYAGPEVMEKYTSWIAYYGAWFDENQHGDAYSKYIARDIVEKALHEIYPEAKYLSHIREDYGLAIQTRYSFSGAAELLMGRNYDRTHIQEAIIKEKTTKTFYTSNEEIKKDFKNIRWDYGY